MIKMLEEPEWVFLTEVFNEVEADIVIGFLESEEIPVKKEYTGPFPGLKVIFGQESGFSIMVPADYLQRAKKLLEEEKDE